MTPVLEALPPKLNLTTSNYNNDWLSFLDNGTYIMNIIKNMKINFPEFSEYVIKHSGESWVLVNSETSRSEVSVSYLDKLDFIYDIESPIMPARKQFTINLVIEKIEKGRPSICDEVEL